VNSEAAAGWGGGEAFAVLGSLGGLAALGDFTRSPKEGEASFVLVPLAALLAPWRGAIPKSPAGEGLSAHPLRLGAKTTRLSATLGFRQRGGGEKSQSLHLGLTLLSFLHLLG